MTRIDLARASDLSSGVPSGTSFPGSPTADDLFYRTDRNLLYFYDGTRWLTLNLYRDTIGPGDIAATPTTTSPANVGRLTPWHDTDLWLDTLYTTLYVATTNTGSAYWTYTLYKANAAGTETSIVSVNTSANTVNNYVTAATAIGALLGNFETLVAKVAKTGSPGSVYWAGALAYRLVG